jgi:mxaA protein
MKERDRTGQRDRIRHSLLAAVLLLAMAGSDAGAADAATVDQPRAFGHVIGDVLTQRVLLDQGGRRLQPGALPGTARVDLWLERRPSRIETDARGRRWLAIDYQVINAPRTLTAISLPAISIATESDEPLALPAWPVSIGPLTPLEVTAQGDLQPLRPDRPATPLATYAIERQLNFALLALLAVVLAWLGWWAWRNRREAQQLPFASAWRELKRIGDPASPEAWRIVHRAINRSAGRVVHGASLPQLMAAAPYLRPLQPRLEDFYRESTRRFFFAPSAATVSAAAGTAYPLKPLCRALRNAEKRHRQ